MARRILWLVVSCMMAISLLVASCTATTAEEEEEEEEVVTEEEEEAVTEEEEEEEEVMLSPEVPKYGGMLVTAARGDPRGWDPGIQQVVNVNQVRLVLESLIRGDWGKGLAGTGENDWKTGNMGMVSLMTGCLAESWEMPDDDTTVYHIRQGVYWWDKPPTNGREFTAEDAAYCINREWTSGKSYPCLSNPPGDFPTSIKALDKYTLEIKIPAHMQGVNMFITEYIRMLPHEVVETYGDMNDWENVCGTGPYMLDDYVVSSSVTYKRNPNYWGVDPIHPENNLPYLDGLKELIIPDASTQQAAFRTGKIDRLTGVQTDDWKMFMGANPELQYSEGFPGTPSFPCGKTDEEGLPFKDVRVRQAMNLAVDQKDILDNYYGGYGTILAYPFLPTPPFSKGYVPLEEMPESVQELFECKPERAKELLAEAGYPDGFKTEIYIGTDQADLLSIIKEYLAAANIDLELVVGDSSTVAAAVKGRKFNEMAMSMTYPFAYYKMHEVRQPDASNASAWSDDLTMAAYNTVLENLGKNDDAVMGAVKGVVPHILENSWGIWLPQPYYYTMWWPWLQNYHGEVNFGSTVPAEERIWLWYDTAMKKSMGY